MVGEPELLERGVITPGLDRERPDVFPWRREGMNLVGPGLGDDGIRNRRAIVEGGKAIPG